MSDRPTSFESKDTSVRVLALLMGGLLVLIGGTLGSMRLLDRWLQTDADRRHPPRSPMAQPSPLPPEPRLQVNPTVDLIRLHDVENVTLESTAWVDGSSENVRIPIERAMALLAQRGLPARRRKEP